jgi:hypothetical protein
LALDCAFTEFFGLGGDNRFVTVLHCYLDESGKFHDHSVVSLCGFVGDRSQIEGFQNRWRELLRYHGMRSMKMAKAVRFGVSLGARRKATGLENRKTALSNFIECITDNFSVGINLAVDVPGFQALNEAQRKAMGGEPHYLAFKRVLGEIVRYYKEPDIRVAVVCDDEQSYSPECYRILNALRSQHHDFQRKVISICFADDDYFVPLQAADMLAYLVRCEAERQFFGKAGHQFGSLFDQLISPPHGKGPTLLGGFFGKEELRSLAAKVK